MRISFWKTTIPRRPGVGWELATVSNGGFFQASPQRPINTRGTREDSPFHGKFPIGARRGALGRTLGVVTTCGVGRRKACRIRAETWQFRP